MGVHRPTIMIYCSRYMHGRPSVVMVRLGHTRTRVRPILEIFSAAYGPSPPVKMPAHRVHGDLYGRNVPRMALKHPRLLENRLARLKK